MPAITFDRFDGGLDVRQLASSADANRLRTLKNAYVTTGRTIRKRPGLRKVADLPTGCKGLFSGLDALWTFSGRTVDYVVSTHSRPKAAGRYLPSGRLKVPCFNSQPPEGGWPH